MLELSRVVLLEFQFAVDNNKLAFVVIRREPVVTTV